MRKYTAAFEWFPPRDIAPDMLFKDDKRRTIRATTDGEALTRAGDIVKFLRKSGEEPWWRLTYLKENKTGYLVFHIRDELNVITQPRD